MRWLTMLLVTWVGWVAAATDPGVTVIHGGKVHTVDATRPQAGAVAYDESGLILAVGSDAEVRERYPDARHIDLKGATVVPGLVDAHAHLMGLGLNLMRVDLVDTTSKAEAIQRLQAFAEGLPADAWLLGRGWDQNDWPEQAFPTRGDLDRHFPDRPVWLRRIDGHAGWANSAALSRADREFAGTWQPEGGRVIRDETGQATGVLVDRAMALIDDAVPSPGPQELARALELALAKTASLGLTGVHEAGTSSAALSLYQQFEKQERLTMRIYAMADGDADALRAICETGFVGGPDALIAMRSVKLYADGALGSRGAALLAPYADDPGNSGLLIQSPEALSRQVEVAMGCGLQVNVHAIGDRGNRVVLDAIAAASRRHSDNPGRHRIEHAQVIALEDLPRFARLGIIASMQPTHATSDMYWAEDRVGPQRIAGAYAWRRLIDLGVPMSFGSDFPVERVNPMLGFHAAVTRQDAKGWPEGGWLPDQRVNRAEALHFFTLGAAYAAFAEDHLGSVTAGKRADLVVLDRDILSVPETELLETRVLATIVDGRTVYHAGQGIWPEE